MLKVGLWFMAKHMFGSFCLAKHETLDVKQRLKRRMELKPKLLCGLTYFFREKKIMQVPCKTASKAPDI